MTAVPVFCAVCGRAFDPTHTRIFLRDGRQVHPGCTDKLPKRPVTSSAR